MTVDNVFEWNFISNIVLNPISVSKATSQYRSSRFIRKLQGLYSSYSERYNNYQTSWSDSHISKYFDAASKLVISEMRIRRNEHQRKFGTIEYVFILICIIYEGHWNMKRNFFYWFIGYGYNCDNNILFFYKIPSIDMHFCHWIGNFLVASS